MALVQIAMAQGAQAAMIQSLFVPDVASKHRRRYLVCWKSLWAVFFPFVVSACWAQSEFAGQSLEQLMNVEVTSVSKKEQKLSKAAAAVFVITQEDIRRSGATSIPDLLRMVPGVQVLRMDANTWAISIRGFNTVTCTMFWY